MKKLLEIAKNILENQFSGINPRWSIIPQLMLAVFNEETKDNLDLKMYDRQDMEQEVLLLLNYSDKAVWVMLGLNN